jgi:hypothetical protein
MLRFNNYEQLNDWCVAQLTAGNRVVLDFSAHAGQVFTDDEGAMKAFRDLLVESLFIAFKTGMTDEITVNIEAVHNEGFKGWRALNGRILVAGIPDEKFRGLMKQVIEDARPKAKHELH